MLRLIFGCRQRGNDLFTIHFLNPPRHNTILVKMCSNEGKKG